MWMQGLSNTVQIVGDDGYVVALVTPTANGVALKAVDGYKVLPDNDLEQQGPHCWTFKVAVEA